MKLVMVWNEKIGNLVVQRNIPFQYESISRAYHDLSYSAYTSMVDLFTFNDKMYSKSSIIDFDVRFYTLEDWFSIFSGN